MICEDFYIDTYLLNRDLIKYQEDYSLIIKTDGSLQRHNQYVKNIIEKTLKNQPYWILTNKKRCKPKIDDYFITIVQFRKEKINEC